MKSQMELLNQSYRINLGNHTFSLNPDQAGYIVHHHVVRNKDPYEINLMDDLTPGHYPVLCLCPRETEGSLPEHTIFQIAD